MRAPHFDPTASSLAEAVTRVGFRKWYERELMRGHAHLLLALLSVIALLGSMEAFRGASVAAKLMDVGFMMVCAAVAYWALRRYLFLLMRAESIANQASCAACGEYGRFKVVADDPRGHQTEVCCRKCANRWLIDSGS